jgi:hypothetical protein
MLRAVQRDGDDSNPVELSWQLVHDPDYINMARRAADVYKHNVEDALAIAISRLRVAGQLARQPADFPEYVFGSRFVQSIDDLSVLRGSFRVDAIDAIFEAICRVLAGDVKYYDNFLHVLREGVGRNGGPIQRRRDGAREDAYRIRVEVRREQHVSHHLHVHFWKGENDRCEFSNVTYAHDDDTIYE